MWRIAITFCFFYVCIFAVQAQTIISAPLTCISKDTLHYSTAPTAGCGAFAGYNIYVATAALGPYTLAASLPLLTDTVWHDPTAQAGKSYYYYVIDSYNCLGATYIAPDTLLNEPNPQTPEIVNVSVLPNGNALLQWKSSASPQACYYIIYTYLPIGQILPLDTVYGHNTTTWIDTIQHADQQSDKYTIAAGDCCGNPHSAFNTHPHATVYLKLSSNRCQRAVALTWNKYISYPQGVARYLVFVSRNNTPDTLIGQTDSATLAFDYTAFDDKDSLCFEIIAVSKADTTIRSTSNRICFRASIVQPPDYFYITNITVDTGNNITTTWVTDPKANVSQFQIYGSDDCANFKSRISFAPTLPLSLYAHYTDSATDASANPFCYYIIETDSCGHKLSTPHATSINLTGGLSDYYEITLAWNPFVLDSARVLYYNIYREDGTGYHLIHIVGATATAYLDSLYQYVFNSGRFCYRVQAVYTLQLANAGLYDTLISWSNVQCIEHRPVVYIPNAFVPNGINNTFKPRIVFGDPQQYSMMIFNRYGGKIFESIDPSIGWDGMDHGSRAMQGGYVYLIQFNAADGAHIERKGIVILVDK